LAISPQRRQAWQCVSPAWAADADGDTAPGFVGAYFGGEVMNITKADSLLAQKLTGDMNLGAVRAVARHRIAATTTLTTENAALAARVEALEGALRIIAERDLLEISGYHTRTWCIAETGSEYESKDPVFKRSAFQNAQEFQAMARAALAGDPS